MELNEENNKNMISETEKNIFTKITGNKYKIENIELGSGAYGVVFLGENIEISDSLPAINKLNDTLAQKQNPSNCQEKNSNLNNINKFVAIKKVSLIQKKVGKEDVLSILSTEIKIMKKMNHINIIEFKDVFKTELFWYIIMEYCNAGTLENVIIYNEKPNKNIITFNREANTYYYMNQLKDALNYIRCLGYIHRDIKPMNVLLTETISNVVPLKKRENFYYTENLIVKLADFGLARYYDETGNSLAKTICGSPMYMAPEIIIDREYNSKVDLWSFGTILYQMSFGTLPNEATSLTQLVAKLKSKRIDFSLNKNLSPECLDLTTKLLNKNSQDRISWDIFFNHKWFLKWKDLIQSNNNSRPTLIVKNRNPSVQIPKKSEPIKITNDYKQSKHMDFSQEWNKSTELKEIYNNSVSQYDSPKGFSNLTRMKIDNTYSQNTKFFTYSNQTNAYSPIDARNFPQISVSAPINNSQQNILSTTSREKIGGSRSRMFKSYKQNMNISKNDLMEMSGTFSSCSNMNGSMNSKKIILESTTVNNLK